MLLIFSYASIFIRNLHIFSTYKRTYNIGYNPIHNTEKEEQYTILFFSYNHVGKCYK